MKLINKRVVTGLALTATLVLSACGGDSGDSSDSSGDASASIDSLTSSDFSFPAVTQTGENAEIATPVGSTPDYSARRTVAKGTGSTVAFGDPVVLEYNMYSWSTGELVQSTDQLEEPLTVLAGVSTGIPAYLSKALLGRQIGDTVQVVFEQGMEDLPSNFDSSDAYVLVVTLL